MRWLSWIPFLLKNRDSAQKGISVAEEGFSPCSQSCGQQRAAGLPHCLATPSGGAGTAWDYSVCGSAEPGVGVSELPASHCSSEGSRQAFWRYLIFACVSFPVCFPLTGAVPLTPDALVLGPFYLLISHAYFSLLFSWFSVTLSLSPRLTILALQPSETSVMSLIGWKWLWHLHFPLCFAHSWVSH